MKSRYVSLRKNPAGSPEKKISYPGKGTRFGKHLFITYVKIEYTLCFGSYLPDPFMGLQRFKCPMCKVSVTKFEPGSNET